MASNLSVSIGANVANLQAQVGVGVAALRKLESEAKRLERSLATTFDAGKAAQLPQVYQQIGAQQQKNAQYTKELTAATTSLTSSFTQQHGALAQLSFQFNDLFTQIASGTSVQQALIQQGGQIVQIFQTSSGAAAVFGAAMRAIVSPLGLIISGIAAVGGTFALFAYSMADAARRVRELNVELYTTGRFTGPTQAAVESVVKAAPTTVGVSGKDTREIATEIAKTTSLEGQDLQRAVEMALKVYRGREALGVPIELKDAAKAISEIFQGTARAGVEAASKLIALNDEERRLIESGHVLEARSSVIKRLAESYDQMYGSIIKAKQAQDDLNVSMQTGAAAFGGGMAFPLSWIMPYIKPQTQGEGAAPGQVPTPSVGPSAGSEQMRAWLAAHGYTPEATAAIMGNARIESNFNPASLSPGGAFFGLFQWDRNRRSALGNPPSTDFNRQMELMHEELSKRLPGFRTSTAPPAELAGQFDRYFEVSAGTSRAARMSAAQTYYTQNRLPGMPGAPPLNRGAAEQQKEDQERADRERDAAERRAMIEHRHTLEQQLKDAKEYHARIVQEAGVGSAKELEARQAVAQKEAELADQQKQIELTGIKERETASVDLTKKIEAAEAAIAAARKRGEAPGGGGVNPQEIQQLEQQRDALRRELYKQENDLAVARVQERIAAEKDPLKRVPMYREIEEIRRTGGANIPHTPQALAPIGIDPVAAQQAASQTAAAQRQAQAETLAAKQEEVSRMRQMGQMELQEFTAQQQLLVARHQITQEQALAAEAAATDAWLAKQRERLVALLAEAEALGASAREIEKFKDAITQIDLERKTKKAEFETKEAEAQERRLQKLAEPIKQAFSSIESSIESAVTGLLTGKTTWQKAMEQIKDSIIGGLVHSVFGSLSKGLASAMGAKEGESLGEFIGTKIGKSLFSGMTSGIGGGAGGAGGGGGGLFSGGLFSFLTMPFHLFGFSHGGIIPAAAGGWALPNSFGSDRVLSALSPGEMVLPRQISQGLQSAIGGGGFGGGDTHQYSINVSAIDARSGAQFLMSHGDAIAASLGRSRRNFNQAGR